MNARPSGVVALLVLLGLLSLLASPGGAQADRPLYSGTALVFPWVVSDPDQGFETLIVVTRPSLGASGGTTPIHLVFYDPSCTKLDRDEALSLGDVDIYAAGAFALGDLVGNGGERRGGHLMVHVQSNGGGGGGHTAVADVLIGEAFVMDFNLGSWAGYSAYPVQRTTAPAPEKAFLAAPSFFGNIPNTLDSLLVLAAAPLAQSAGGPVDLDSLPASPTTVDFLIWSPNEEPHSSRATFTCGLVAFLPELDPIALAQNLATDAATPPELPGIPYGWVLATLSGPADGATPTRTFWTTGIMLQRLAFTPPTGAPFASLEITNLWRLSRDIIAP